jgi:hypothetical protein
VAQIDIAQIARRNIKACSNSDIHEEEEKEHNPIRIQKTGQKQEPHKHQYPESVEWGHPFLKHV